MSTSNLLLVLVVLLAAGNLAVSLYLIRWIRETADALHLSIAPIRETTKAIHLTSKHPVRIHGPVK